MEASFKDACNNATEYPKNLLQAHSYDYRLVSLHRHLQSQKATLCSIDEEEVCLWEKSKYDQTKARKFTIVSNIQMRQHLGLDTARLEQDPSCRFIFITAHDSRSSLLVTFETLSTILTFHQVMPQFVDFLLSFGKHETSHDFHHIGFSAQSPLLGNGSRPQLSALGRSISALQICYNLRAPEQHEFQPHWPWSLRQATAHHSFDLESGRSLWIIVKASNSLRDRISKAPDVLPGVSEDLNGRTTFDLSLAASFATHLIFCHWAVEEWRWYINFLEGQMQDHTGRGLYVMADGNSEALADWAKSARPEPEPKQGAMFRRIASGFSLISRPSTFPQANSPNLAPPHSSTSEFAFDKLQRTQDIGERSKEALLILKANAEVLAALKAHYRDLFDTDLGYLATSGFESQIDQFDKQINELERTLKNERARVDTLATLIDDRKNLLYGLLDHQNMRANKLSTRKMEETTDRMHEIAKKTQQDTVSMKIITFITLIFLPGTFISTIMSTDIVSWNSDPPSGHLVKVVSIGALRFFMMLTVPLIVLTFVVWAVIYKSENWRSEESLARESRSSA